MSGPTSLSSTPTTSPASNARSAPYPLIGLSLGAGAGFVALYLLVVRTYWGQRLDEYAFIGHDFFASRAAQADSFLRVVSVGSLLLAVTLIAAVAILRRRPKLALIAAASIVVSLIATELLKLVLLERPPLLPSFIYDNSYPSGHTTVGMSVAVAAMLVVPRRLLFATAAGAGLFGSAFGVAVVAAGWHRPSDAVGSFLVVLSVAAAAAAITYLSPDRADLERRKGRAVGLPRLQFGTTELGLLALALGGLGLFGLAALSYRGIPWTSTGAGFLLSALAIVVCGFVTTMVLAAAMRAADTDRGSTSGRQRSRTRPG